MATVTKRRVVQAKKNKRQAMKSITARKHSAEALRQARAAARARRMLGSTTDNEVGELVKMAMVC